MKYKNDNVPVKTGTGT